MYEIAPGPQPYAVIVAVPEFYSVVYAVDSFCHTIGRHAVVTSGAEGVHGKASRHYYNLAWDFRTVKACRGTGVQCQCNGHIPPDHLQPLVEWVRAELPPPAWFVLLETDHLHVERKVLP